MVYHFKVHEEQNGFWAECVEIAGCFTQGESISELKKNAAEALNLHLSEPENSKTLFPGPARKPKGRNLLAVPVDFQVAMAMRIRQARLKSGLTQRKAADLLGFDHLSAYQKLESYKTCNPGLAMLARITKVFPSIKVDEILSLADY